MGRGADGVHNRLKREIGFVDFGYPINAGGKLLSRQQVLLSGKIKGGAIDPLSINLEMLRGPYGSRGSQF